MAAAALGAAIRAAVRIGGALPERAAHRMAVAGGTLEWALRPKKRRILRENLAHAVPGASAAELGRLVRREVVNEARRSADLLWALRRPDEMLARLRIENLAAIERPLDEGRGVILAGPHIGGWEIVAPVPYAVLGVRASVLVTDDWLAWAMEPFRRAAGLRPEFVSQPPRAAAERLRRGELLLMFCDIVPPGARTMRVRLLDDEIDLPAGPATLARLGNAVLVPLAVLPVAPRAWRCLLGDPIEPPSRGGGAEGEARTLQRLADAWSVWLQQYPEHWAAVYPLPWHPDDHHNDAAPSADPAITSAR